MKQEGPKSEQKTSWRTKTQAPPEISSLRIDGWGDKTCIIPQMEFMKLTESATLKLSDSTCNTLPSELSKMGYKGTAKSCWNKKASGSKNPKGKTHHPRVTLEEKLHLKPQGKLESKTPQAKPHPDNLWKTIIHPYSKEREQLPLSRIPIR